MAEEVDDTAFNLWTTLCKSAMLDQEAITFLKATFEKPDANISQADNEIYLDCLYKRIVHKLEVSIADHVAVMNSLKDILAKREAASGKKRKLDYGITIRRIKRSSSAESETDIEDDWMEIETVLKKEVKTEIQRCKNHLNKGKKLDDYRADLSLDTFIYKFMVSYLGKDYMSTHLAKSENRLGKRKMSDKHNDLICTKTRELWRRHPNFSAIVDDGKIQSGISKAFNRLQSETKKRDSSAAAGHSNGTINNK